LSDKQIEALHFRVLEIMERVGVTFECQEALDLLSDAGADVSNPKRVKIPSYLVEQAIRTAPKSITLYTREGEPAITLNQTQGAHFGTLTGCPYFLDPYTRQPRLVYVEDTISMSRLCDALPNIDWIYTTIAYRTVPADIADKVVLLQAILNNSKPVAVCSNDVASFREMVELCSIVAGGEEQLRAKPFLIGTSEPVSPVVQGKDAMEKSLLCAEKGLPNFIYGMQMSGATTPATFAGTLVISAAESLSQLVVVQLKNPGTPVIFGGMPGIMDMKTTTYSFGAPELSLMIGALTELSHYYGLPMFGTAGATDARSMGAQMAAEVTYSCFLALLTGADLVHDISLMYSATMESPELTVFADEVIGMLKAFMRGIEVNDETIPMDLIERVGPGGNFLSEAHTLQHFRKFWVPTIFDRSREMEKAKFCEDLLNEKTIKILETYEPKPLPEDTVKELKKVEAGWFKRLGIEHKYLKRE